MYAFADGIFFDAEPTGAFLYGYPALGCVLVLSHTGEKTIRTGSERASEANLAPLRKRRGPGAHGGFRVPARKKQDGRKAGSGPPCVALDDPLASRKGPIPHDTGLFLGGAY